MNKSHPQKINFNFPLPTQPILQTHLNKEPTNCNLKIKFIKQLISFDSHSSSKGIVYFPSHWALECPLEFNKLNKNPNYNVQLSEHNLVYWKKPLTHFHKTPYNFPILSNTIKREIIVGDTSRN